MQKTYLWRIVLSIVCVSILIGAYIGPCEYRLGRCLGGNNIILTRTFFHFTLSFLFMSPFLFFVNDAVFKKWLRFSIAWFVLAAILITLAPEYRGGWLGIGPEKESVSIWASVLFVILSIAKLSWDSWKNSIK